MAPDPVRFRRLDDERVEVVLDRYEADVLLGLPDQVRELVELGEGAVHDRLFPRAHVDPTEDAAEAEWQRLMHGEILEAKLGALEVMGSTLASAVERVAEGEPVVVTLDAEETAAWLGGLNDTRLALGVMLEVTEDLDIARVPADDPRAPGLHLYGWLTWLQGELIETLNP